MRVDRSIALIAFFALVMMAAAALIALPFVQRSQLQADLSRALRMYRIGYTSHIELVAFTEFEWDAVYLFPPYSTRNAIETALGFAWGAVRQTTIDRNDSVTLIVFTHGGRVVRWIEMPRTEGDFSSLAGGSPFPPEKALFFFPVEESPVLGVLNIDDTQ